MSKIDFHKLNGLKARVYNEDGRAGTNVNKGRVIETTERMAVIKFEGGYREAFNLANLLFNKIQVKVNKVWIDAGDVVRSE